MGRFGVCVSSVAAIGLAHDRRQGTTGHGRPSGIHARGKLFLAVRAPIRGRDHSYGVRHEKLSAADISSIMAASNMEPANPTQEMRPAPEPCRTRAASARSNTSKIRCIETAAIPRWAVRVAQDEAQTSPPGVRSRYRLSVGRERPRVRKDILEQLERLRRPDRDGDRGQSDNPVDIRGTQRRPTEDCAAAYAGSRWRPGVSAGTDSGVPWGYRGAGVRS
jgi:hypothetical protein